MFFLLFDQILFSGCIFPLHVSTILNCFLLVESFYAVPAYFRLLPVYSADVRSVVMWWCLQYGILWQQYFCSLVCFVPCISNHGLRCLSLHRSGEGVINCVRVVGLDHLSSISERNYPISFNLVVVQLFCLMISWSLFCLVRMWHWAWSIGDLYRLSLRVGDKLSLTGTVTSFASEQSCDAETVGKSTHENRSVLLGIW